MKRMKDKVNMNECIEGELYIRDMLPGNAYFRDDAAIVGARGGTPGCDDITHIAKVLGPYVRVSNWTFGTFTHVYRARSLRPYIQDLNQCRK